MGKFKIWVSGLWCWAEVAEPGQRRRIEVPISKEFVGSNPTLRTISFGLTAYFLGPFLGIILFYLSPCLAFRGYFG